MSSPVDSYHLVRDARYYLRVSENQATGYGEDVGWGDDGSFAAAALHTATQEFLVLGIFVSHIYFEFCKA